MISTQDLLSELNEALPILKKAIADSGALNPYTDPADKMRNVRADDTPDDIFLRDQLSSILSSVSFVVSQLDYLQQPVSEESTLQKMKGSDQYYSGNHIYHANESIEYLCNDWKHTTPSGRPLPYWKLSRLAHGKHGYYIADDRDQPLNGLTVRERYHHW